MTTRQGPQHGQSGRGPRVERVAKQLRQEISKLMLTEMKDPRVRLASVTEVRLSRDLRQADVMVSVIGEEAERRLVIGALRHAEGYLRGELGNRLENLRQPPHMRFHVDESIAYSVRINSVLRDLTEHSQPVADPGVPDEIAAPQHEEREVQPTPRAFLRQGGSPQPAPWRSARQEGVLPSADGRPGDSGRKEGET